MAHAADTRTRYDTVHPAKVDSIFEVTGQPGGFPQLMVASCREARLY
jgi:hypothetical protein